MKIFANALVGGYVALLINLAGYGIGDWQWYALFFPFIGLNLLAAVHNRFV